MAGQGWKRAAGIIFLIASLSLAARAQDRAKDLGAASLEDLLNVEISSASKYVQRSAEAPAHITVITAEQIRKFGYRTFTDLLRGVGGFYVTSDRNYDYVGVRGFGRPGDYNTRILLLIDGHRMNDCIYDGANLGTDFILDLDLIERVEVIRGPSSSMYGTSAFFAIVNVIPKRGRNLNGARLSGEAGSFGSARTSAAYGGTRRQIEFLVSGSFDNSQGQQLYFPEFDTPATNHGVVAHGDGDRFHSLFATVAHKYLTFQTAYVSRRKMVPTASFGTAFNDGRERTVDQRGYADLRWERSLPRAWAFAGRVYYDQYDYDGVYPYAAETDPPGTVVEQDYARGKWWGTEQRVVGAVRRRHKLELGAEFRHAFRADQGSYDVAPYVLYLQDRRSFKNWALYAQDEMRLGARWRLTLGLRHDQYENFAGATNPRLALIYERRRHTVLKFIYGTAFRAPSIYELYYYGQGYDITGALKPERIATNEIIVEQMLRRHFRLVAAAYYNRIDALISQSTLPDGSIVFRNADQAHSRGIDLQFQGTHSSGVRGAVSYNFQRSEDAQTKLTLSNSPRHLAKLRVSIPVPGQWNAGIEGQYMSRRTTVSGASLGGFGVMNATLVRPGVARNLDFSASVYNVFDKRYSDPGAEEHSQTGIRQDGRAFRVKLEYRF